MSAKLAAKRTLTNLYNSRPTWLEFAHKQLDEAVCAAYGWDESISDQSILEGLLSLNLEREIAQREAADEESEEDDEDLGDDSE